MFFSASELVELVWSKQEVDRWQRKLLGSGKEAEIGNKQYGRGGQQKGRIKLGANSG